MRTLSDIANLNPEMCLQGSKAATEHDVHGLAGPRRAARHGGKCPADGWPGRCPLFELQGFLNDLDYNGRLYHDITTPLCTFGKALASLQLSSWLKLGLPGHELGWTT